jgi:hypothetical protein
MPNTSRINGFRPVLTGNGSAWSGQMNRYFVPTADATAIGIGDLVKISGLASVNGVRGVTKAAVGDAVVGAVVGVSFNPLNLNTPVFRAANANIIDGGQYVFVADDPNTVYEAQVAGALLAADVGLNANHVDAGVSTTTGLSGQSVDGSTKATTATLTLKVLEIVQRDDNESFSTLAKVRVKINNHQLASGTGTLGIA